MTRTKYTVYDGSISSHHYYYPIYETTSERKALARAYQQAEISNKVYIGYERKGADSCAGWLNYTGHSRYMPQSWPDEQTRSMIEGVTL